MPDLGFELIKTKDENWWHRKDGGGGIVPSDGDDDDGGEEDDEKAVKTKTDYPSFYIDNCPKEMCDLPDEGTAIVKFKVIRRIQSEDSEGKTRYEVALDIMSFDQQKEEPKKRNGSGPLATTKDRMDSYFGK